MSRLIANIDPAPAQAPGILVPALIGKNALTPASPDSELETPQLPRELPQWVRDALSVSAKARDLISRLLPVAIRVLTFWDHTARSTMVSGRRLTIDPSGSYRAS